MKRTLAPAMLIVTASILSCEGALERPEFVTATQVELPSGDTVPLGASLRQLRRLRPNLIDDSGDVYERLSGEHNSIGYVFDLRPEGMHIGPGNADTIVAIRAVLTVADDSGHATTERSLRQFWLGRFGDPDTLSGFFASPMGLVAARRYVWRDSLVEIVMVAFDEPEQGPRNIIQVVQRPERAEDFNAPRVRPR